MGGEEWDETRHDGVVLEGEGGASVLERAPSRRRERKKAARKGTQTAGDPTIHVPFLAGEGGSTRRRCAGGRAPRDGPGQGTIAPAGENNGAVRKGTQMAGDPAIHVPFLAGEGGSTRWRCAGGKEPCDGPGQGTIAPAGERKGAARKGAARDGVVREGEDGARVLERAPSRRRERGRSREEGGSMRWSRAGGRGRREGLREGTVTPAGERKKPRGRGRRWRVIPPSTSPFSPGKGAARNGVVLEGESRAMALDRAPSHRRERGRGRRRRGRGQHAMASCGRERAARWPWTGHHRTGGREQQSGEEGDVDGGITRYLSPLSRRGQEGQAQGSGADGAGAEAQRCRRREQAQGAGAGSRRIEGGAEGTQTASSRRAVAADMRRPKNGEGRGGGGEGGGEGERERGGGQRRKRPRRRAVRRGTGNGGQREGEGEDQRDSSRSTSEARSKSDFLFWTWLVPGSAALTPTTAVPSNPSSAGLSRLVSSAELLLVMSWFVGSAGLKLAQLGWLSQFEPSRGNTSPRHNDNISQNGSPWVGFPTRHFGGVKKS
ncbi:hypothetical protein V8E53_003023 [Lactarius tabidus]